ncbi:MAG: hypothetical protein AAGF26_09565 [Cyanobacteria bacterium P01_G01_bin.49]
MSKPHWLDITEYILVTCSIGGIVGTIITKQILLTASPLTLSIFLNLINRRRQLQKIRNCPEVTQLSEARQEYFNITDEYRFRKLEYDLNMIHEATTQFNQQLSRFKHKDRKLKYYWDRTVNKGIIDVLLDCIMLNQNYHTQHSCAN